MNDAPTLKSERTPIDMRVRLGVMFFLQYFMQGAYLPIASLYLHDHLHFSAWQVGVFGSGLAFGAMLSPFISGQIADRVMSTDRFLALSHAIGGGVMLLIWSQKDPWIVLPLAFLYSILYVPTISLTNTISFRNLSDPEGEFPILRMFGTIGFIAVPWLFDLFPWLLAQSGNETLVGLSAQLQRVGIARGGGFLVSGISGLVMAAYCLTLPYTPPDRTAKVRFAPLQAIRLLTNRAFLVIVLASLPIAMVHTFHFVWNSVYLKAAGVAEDWVLLVSSVGQICEIAVIAFLGLMIKRLGFKWTLCIGMLAYVLRNLIFALVPPVPVLVVAQGLHGFCFACFLATAFILVDKLAPRDARASVQTFFSVFALGLGAFLGGAFAGWIGELSETFAPQPSYDGGIFAGAVDYLSFNIDFLLLWIVPCSLALATLIVFLFAFPREPLEDARGTGKPLGD